MSFYRGKLKRLIVLGGVALALLPCLQQTHVLCRLAGCTSPALAGPTNLVAIDSADCDGCCGPDSDLPSQAPAQDAGDGFPCGPDCWCSQPVDPREAPRHATDSAKSQITTLHLQAPANFVVASQFNCDMLQAFWPDSLPCLSAGETCVRLCRFLT
jgi:hypothetical protein